VRGRSGDERKGKGGMEDTGELKEGEGKGSALD